jgi:dienelactone hydrolase
MTARTEERALDIAAGGALLQGDLRLPVAARRLVLFAHGSGSSRASPRNRSVAQALNEAALATLLFDLLTREEEAVDAAIAHLRFDIAMLGERLVAVTDWVARQSELHALPVGYFGASTGAAAALVAAAQRPALVRAVVSRGGRPDLAGLALHRVQAATLLVVGGRDPVVIQLNREAYGELSCEKELVIVPGATHLFEEPGTRDEVARLACAWFRRHLAGERR